MSFSEELQAICQEVPGSRASVLMSLDGISVARHEERQGDLDLEILLVEMASSLTTARKAVGAVEAGKLRFFEVASDQGTLLVQLLTDEYFVAMYLDSDAQVGRGRYALRRHSLSLLQELE